MGLPRLSLLSEDDEIPILLINLHKMSWPSFIPDLLSLLTRTEAHSNAFCTSFATNSLSSSESPVLSEVMKRVVPRPCLKERRDFSLIHFIGYCDRDTKERLDGKFPHAAEFLVVARAPCEDGKFKGPRAWVKGIVQKDNQAGIDRYCEWWTFLFPNDSPAKYRSPDYSASKFVHQCMIVQLRRFGPKDNSRSLENEA
jgi:hypothetical protein